MGAYEVWQSAAESEYDNDWAGHVCDIFVVDDPGLDVIEGVRISAARIVPMLSTAWEVEAAKGKPVVITGKVMQLDGKAYELVNPSRAEQLMVDGRLAQVASALGLAELEAVDQLPEPPERPQILPRAVAEDSDLPADTTGLRPGDDDADDEPPPF
jgi:hypothetical protein